MDQFDAAFTCFSAGSPRMNANAVEIRQWVRSSAGHSPHVTRLIRAGEAPSQRPRACGRGCAKQAVAWALCRPIWWFWLRMTISNNFNLASSPFIVGVADEYTPLGDMGIPKIPFRGNRLLRRSVNQVCRGKGLRRRPCRGSTARIDAARIPETWS